MHPRAQVSSPGIFDTPFALRSESGSLRSFLSKGVLRRTPLTPPLAAPE